MSRFVKLFSLIVSLSVCAVSVEATPPRTTAEILADVNAALASNHRSTMLALASGLDSDNNLGCPLN